MADRKIVQIMAADGWGAAFEDGEDEVVSPLVGWALVQEANGSSAVVGLVAADEKVELCDDDDEFTGYVFLPDAASDEFEIESDIFQEEDDDEDFGGDDDDEDFGGDDPASDGPAFPPKAGRLN